MDAPSSSKLGAEAGPQRKGNLIRRRRQRAQIGKDGRVWLLWELLLAGAAVGVTAQLLFLAWWRPYLGVTGGATSLGVGAGLLYAFLYSLNCKRKVELNQLVRRCSKAGLAEALAEAGSGDQRHSQRQANCRGCCWWLCWVAAMSLLVYIAHMQGADHSFSKVPLCGMFPATAAPPPPPWPTAAAPPPSPPQP
jgi:hypothetical protein